MKEIREKIAALRACYTRQLELYEQICELAVEERQMIDQGSLDCLLQLLEAKGTLLQQVTFEEKQIKELQNFLVSHFQLPTFSIPQLREVASVRYHGDLATLAGVVEKLVAVLEHLEQQEREHEAILNRYLQDINIPDFDQIQTKRASRAYRRKKP